MRFRPRAFLRAALLLALLGGPSSPQADAGTVAYNFSGRIQTVSQAATNATGVLVGNKITGSFAYDPTQTGSITNGTYTFTGSSKVHALSFKIFNAAGSQIFTDSYSGNVTAYYFAQVSYGGTAGTKLDLMGDTIYKQGLGITHGTNPGTPAFDVTLFNPTNAGGFTATHLPLPDTNLIKNFVPNTGLLSWDPVDQTFTASITFSSTIPEPSSLVTGILGTVTSAAGFWMFRRQRSRHSR
jgi:hypothetical protein